MMATSENSLLSKLTAEDLATLRGLIAQEPLPAQQPPVERSAERIETDDSKKTVKPKSRNKSKKKHVDGLLGDIFPNWGFELGEWFIAQKSLGWLIAGIIITFFVLLPIGIVAGLGNGLASVNGLRLPLASFGLAVEKVPLPVWLIIPVAQFFIQTVVRHIPKLRWLWRPSIIYDGATTAIFIALGIMAFQSQNGRETIIWLTGSFSAFLGLGLAVLAELLLMGTVAMAYTIIRSR